MDYTHYVLVLLCIFGTWSTASASTSTNSTTEAIETTDESSDDKLFGNPFWLGFTVILFISLIVLSLIVSLTYGIHKYRENAKKRGLYRDKNRIYNEREESSHPDYSIFQTDLNHTGEVNASYIGSS